MVVVCIRLNNLTFCTILILFLLVYKSCLLEPILVLVYRDDEDDERYVRGLGFNLNI